MGWNQSYKATPTGRLLTIPRWALRVEVRGRACGEAGCGLQGGHVWMRCWVRQWRNELPYLDARPYSLVGDR